MLIGSLSPLKIHGHSRKAHLCPCPKGSTGNHLPVPSPVRQERTTTQDRDYNSPCRLKPKDTRFPGRCRRRCDETARPELSISLRSLTPQLLAADPIMARITATSPRRRAWLPFILLIVFVLWYRKHHDALRQPWSVVDFQIKDYRHDGGADRGHEASFLDRDRPPKNAQDHQPQIDVIKSRPAFQQQQLSYHELQQKIQDFIQWDRPSTDHWPAWHDYDQTDYDPNRWEALDRSVSASFIPAQC